MIGCLLSHGAQHSRGFHSPFNLPLNVAVQRGLKRTTKVLLENGSEPSSVDGYGKDAFTSCKDSSMAVLLREFM